MGGRGGLYYIEIDVEDAVSGNPKGIVASFRFFDQKNDKIIDNLPSFNSSSKYAKYKYIDTTAAKNHRRVFVFDMPEIANRIEVDLVAFSTEDKITIRHAKIGKVSLAAVSCWLTLKVPGVHWIVAVEGFVHKEGATSLRLALLRYKYQHTNHQSDLNRLNGAIQEMVELDRNWLPRLANSAKRLSVKRTERLTIAHLHKTAYPYENTGGAIRCLNTVLSQQRIGIDPYIITPIGYPRSAGIEGVNDHEIIEGIVHFRVGANTDGIRGLSLPDRTRYSVFHIAKILKQRGANVIHAASGIRGYELALQALALKKMTGLPMIYEVRSFHEHTWTPVRSDVMNLERTQLRVIKENFCMEEADLVITISFSMRKILIERGVAEDKIEVIPNAIDESKYLSKTYSPIPIPALEGAEMVVGYISNMSLREGHQYLIRAIHQLRQQTGRDIRGLLVGDGPERNNLEQLAAELGMKEVIAFPGEVDHGQINTYYKTIDLFVIPRIPDYAADWVTPLKPYEAMALERPIVVTDLPALKEIVGENEERGLVAKPADVKSLATQIQRYIDDPAMRQSKARAAKEWVFAERTWSANAKRYDAIYRRLIARSVSNDHKLLHA
jgi:glycosyltransferase involved in cell wall biosynthesis